MVISKKVYSASHEDVIRQFEMKNKPSIRLSAEDQTLQELVQYALKMAFKDFNFRTLHKVRIEEDKDTSVLDEKLRELKKEKGEEVTVTAYLMEHLGKKFESRFVKYFQGESLSKEEFDRWHHETCQLFLDNLDGTGEYEGLCKIYRNLNYGKAQKIVNMMFKHLYCFQSEENWKTRWEPYFRHCHVTLDNFTLEWFRRQVPPNQRIDSWSNLVYLKTPMDKNDYLFYQTNIRKFFDEQKGTSSIYRDVTPFQAEFYIWPEIQLHLAAEAFVFELNPDDYRGKESDPTNKRADIIKLPVEELIAVVMQEIQKHKDKLR